VAKTGRLELGLALIGVYFGSCVLSADDIGKIRRTVFGELPPWGRLWRRSKDDDAVGSRGLHRGHGVGGARRLGVHLPVSSQ